MSSLTSRQVVRLCGLPNSAVLRSMVRRYPQEFAGLLLHAQRGKGGSLWRSQIVAIAERVWNAQRPRWPWRMARASTECQLRHLPKLDAGQRAALEAKLAALDAAWVKETDARRRDALERDLRYLRRVKKHDDRRTP